MSYLYISDLLADGKRAAFNGCYLSALNLALNLPRICSRIEFKRNNYVLAKWNDEVDYKKWCDKYLNSGYLSVHTNQRTSEFLYKLRCELLQKPGKGFVDNYEDEVYLISSKIRWFGSKEKVVISIPELCNDVFYSVESWLMDKNLTDVKCSEITIFKTENPKEEIAYQKFAEENK